MALNSTQSLELSVDGYCTFASIEPYIPRRSINNTSKPTRAQACHIVRDTFSEINGLLTILGYVVPVASSNGTSVRILGRLNAIGAAAEIEAAAYSAGNTSRSEHAEELRDQYKVMWLKLEKGEIKLIGASLEDNYMRRRNEHAATYLFQLDADGNEAAPTFSKYTEW